MAFTGFDNPFTFTPLRDPDYSGGYTYAGPGIQQPGGVFANGTDVTYASGAPANVAATPQASTDFGAIGAAGIGAAGQTVGILAQLMGQRAAMDRAVQAADTGRLSSERLAKMRLAANERMASADQRAAAQQWLLGAMQNSINSGLDSADTKRMANRGFGNLLARAFVAGK